MAGDFDKLFGDDWRPQDFDLDSGASGRRSGGAFDFFSFGGDGDSSGEDENRAPRALNEKEVKVMGVYMYQEQGAHPQHFVLLRDNKGRHVKIFVGQFEAWAISFALEGDPPDRPMTHDLIKLVLERLDAKIERIVIDDLWNETFYAKIGMVKPNGETIDIDGRPSDAIALALRAHAPIYMAESVLDATVRSE